MREIVTVIVLLSTSCWTAGAQAAPDAPAAIHTRKTQFRIPYRYDAAEMRKLAAQEIRLYASVDQGNSWRHVQTVAPVAGRFDFVAPREGEYWFSVRTLDGQGRLYPPGEMNQPGLKVVVDATPPKFDIAVRQLEPGRVQLAWRIDDPYADTQTLKLEYLQPGNGQWQTVGIVPQAAGQTSWSVPRGGVVSIRGSVSDKAANVARAEARTQVAPGAAPVLRRPPVPSYDEPIAGLELSSETPADSDGFFPEDDLPQISGGQPASNGNSQFVSSRQEVVLPGSGGDVDNVFDQPIGDDFTDSSGNRIVRQKMFDIDYEIGDVGPSGVGAVEFYITRNGGRKWYKLGDDLDRRSPFQVKVPGDGRYGIEIRVRSGAGLAADPPQPGEAPSIVVTVDQTPPVIQLYPVQQGQGASLNKIMIRWQAEDENPSDNSISVAYAATPEGPWTVIQDWGKDNGSFMWNVQEEVVPQLYIGVSARDAAGNVSRVVSSKPIIVDLKKPSAKIVGVKPPAKGARR